MLKQGTHCSKYGNKKQNTNVKNDIKYHKRHFKIFSASKVDPKKQKQRGDFNTNIQK